jgi:Fic family protein
MAFIWETGAWPNLTYDANALQRAFEKVTGKAGELVGLRENLSADDRFDTFIQEISAEGVNSFAIEGEVLDPEHMTQSLIASLRAQDRKMAAGAYSNVAEVMLDARDTSRPMTLDRLNGWHGQLFQSARFQKDVGRLRSEEMQVVTMKRGEVSEVHFEAPPPDRLAQEMQQLVSWIERSGPNGAEGPNYAAPARAAIGHLWFETIHPYSDGNGRIGRAIADYIAAQEPVLNQAPFSLSRAIQKNKQAYYDALQEAQSATPNGEQIDATPFVYWFTGAMSRGIDLAAGEARYIHDRNQFFSRHQTQLNERQEKALRRIFQEGPERLAQGLSSKPYQRITGASSATATRDLNDLAEKGIVQWTGQGGRGRAYDIIVRPNELTQQVQLNAGAPGLQEANAPSADSILSAWADIDAGQQNLSEFRTQVIAAKEAGVAFLAEGGSAVLGPAIARDLDLRTELNAADLAYSQPQNNLGVAYLVDRERSNPYATPALEFLASQSSTNAGLVSEARSDSAAKTEQGEMLVAAELVVGRLNDDQLRAAVRSETKVEQAGRALRAQLDKAFSDPEKANEVIESRAISPTYDRQALASDVLNSPEQFGNVQEFKKGLLGREDTEARTAALNDVKRAAREYAGTVQHFAAEIRTSEAEIAERYNIGVPEPSRELGELIERSAPGQDMLSGIAQGERREKLVAESSNLLRNIEARTGRNIERDSPKRSSGMTAQLVDRLRRLQTKLSEVARTEQARTREVEQARENHHRR